ncbi:MAG TPA: hypothetical protein DCX95_07950 [Elusimicrobia bacterium]|nr:hypothetical protein [Elusimicrobiota bacterium]
MELEIKEQSIAVKLKGLETLWSLRKQVEVGLENVQNVIVGPAPKGYWLRIPGTSIPGIIKAGTYYGRKDGKWKKAFFYIRKGAKVLTIQLKNEKFDILVLEVETPEILAEKIKSAKGGSS